MRVATALFIGTVYAVATCPASAVSLAADDEASASVAACIVPPAPQFATERIYRIYFDPRTTDLIPGSENIYAAIAGITQLLPQKAAVIAIASPDDSGLAGSRGAKVMNGLAALGVEAEPLCVAPAGTEPTRQDQPYDDRVDVVVFMPLTDVGPPYPKPGN